MSAIAVWLIVMLGAGIVEILVPALVFLFVGLAALLTLGVAALGFPVAAQIVFFAAASLLLLLLVRPIFASKRVGGRDVPSRTEALAGRLGRVTEAIDPVRGSGRVNVAGEDWAARAAVAVPVGTEVRVDGAIEVVATAIGAKGSPAQYLIAQRYLESLMQIAAGAQKIVFLPFEAAGVMGSIGGIKELFEATAGGGRAAPSPSPGR
ncbi:MAG TPA: NfeD family protein [Thermoanaerobaculia bacterium]|nr:NfeD family protein [Thermoanaerobaculia bacterium]